MQYNKISLDTKELLNSYIKRVRLLTSDYALPVILTWKEFKSPEIAECDNALFIRGYLDGKRVYLPPLTEDRVDKAMNNLVEYTQSINEPLEVILALKEHLCILDKKKFKFTTNRDYYEYIYNSYDLINLKGKKYHSKRNHINTFNKNYEYEFRDYHSDDYQEVYDLLMRWADSKEDGTIIELDMVKYLLNHMEVLEIFADVLLVDGKIIGTAIGECSNPDMGIVMFEKCDYDYEGSCAVINQLFAEKRYSDVKYINRQEDIGIPGLRKSKLSYKPTRLVHRYTIKLKD